MIIHCWFFFFYNFFIFFHLLTFFFFKGFLTRFQIFSLNISYKWFFTLFEWLFINGCSFCLNNIYFFYKIFLIFYLKNF
jgi:hypothetical protein